MADFLQYGDKRIEFTVSFKKRKTIGLSISRDDGLKVSAPKWVSKKQIMDIVEQKAEWILKKLSEFAKNPDIVALGDGTELLFLGFSHRLEVIDDIQLKKVKIYKLEDKIIFQIPTSSKSPDFEKQIRDYLKVWYKKQAEIIINQRINSLSKQMKVSPSKVTLRQQKTRWGSCSSNGSISINWKLIMMPVAVIDYVLVHELAHLKVLNHSKSFWELVEVFLPDFKNRKLLLKEYGKKLNFP